MVTDYEKEKHIATYSKKDGSQFYTRPLATTRETVRAGHWLSMYRQ